MTRSTEDESVSTKRLIYPILTVLVFVAICAAIVVVINGGVPG